MYGKRIRHYRKLKGLSQAEMAERLYIAAATYSKIETNHTSLYVEMLEKIAAVLEVSPLAIIKEEYLEVNDNEGFNFIIKVNDENKTEKVFHFHKEFVDAMLVSKDIQIDTLNHTLQHQQKLIAQQTVIIEKLLTT